MNLPEEVLLIVFQDKSILSTIDIFQCQLVCKQWRAAAQRTNYTYLTIQEHHNIPKLIQTFQQTPIQYSPGKFVKKLVLTQPSQQQFLIELLDMFPFIDTIQVPEPNFQFYSDLITTVQHEPHVQYYLKDFSAPLLHLSDTKLLEIYTNCALMYRDTLQYVLLYDNTFKLHQFPNLQQLIIKQHTNNNIHSLDNIIDQYPKLKKLDIALYRPESSSLSSHNATTTTDYCNNNLTKVIPRPTIKSLDGLFLVRDDTLRYIVHKFPQLHELSINHSWREDTDKLSCVNMDISLSTLSQFVPYILSIPCCALSLNLETLSITHALETYIKHMPTARLGPLSITYTHAHSDSSSTRWTAHRTTNKNQSHEFYIDYRCQTNALLHLNLLESIGDRLSEITYRTNIDSLKHVHGYFLDHLLQHCPNLKKIRLSSTKLIRCLREPTTTIHPLTHLVLLNCYLGKNVFSQLSDRFKKLEKLVLVRCRFGNSGIDTEYIHINMSQTVLNTIRIKTEHSLITFVTVRVTTLEEEDRFYRLWLDKVSQRYKAECSSLQEYDLMIKTEQHMKIWVECKQVDKIQLFTNSRGNHVIYGQVLVL